MNRVRNNLQLSRRVFLRAAGGAAVALPLLSSLRAGADGESHPKRLVLMYTPNGVIPDAWWPKNVTSETSWELNTIHQGLAPFKDRLLFLNGVDLTVTNDGPGGLHQKGIGGLFTGMQLQDGDLFVDGCGQRAGWANGISIDQELAKTLAVGTPIKSLELGVRATENDVQGRIAYAGPGAPLPPMNDPSEVFQRLFSGFGQNTDQLAELRARRQSVLDTVQSQFKSLSNRVSSADKQKLDAHLALVRDLETRMAVTGNGSASCVAPAVPAAHDPTSEDDMADIAGLHLDMLATAFACDLTRIASFQISTSLNHIRYPWLNSMGEGHALSHMGPSDQDAFQQLVSRQTWHSQMLAKFLTRLSQIPEGSGTVLDNTLVLWGNEVSEGNTHSHESIPFLLAGGGWYFRTGRALSYTNASHNDLLVSVLNAMGLPATTFGQADLCKGPLPGLV
ncbi:MAG TPA: DUF1552 domain-containing protein [Polyangiaceae bacterium]|nr:DUF1552 domain-containing protein [Polyangiaceae bacterium]